MAANLAILDTASPDSLHLESLWFMGGLVTVHAEAPGELAYALAYARANVDTFEIEA